MEHYFDLGADYAHKLPKSGFMKTLVYVIPE